MDRGQNCYCNMQRPYVNRRGASAAVMGNQRQAMQPSDQNFTVAMAYVMWQNFENTYPVCEGFRVGTIFPKLNLPFERTRCMCR